LDTFKLYEDGRLMMAGIYVFASVFLSLIALIIGMVVAREVFA